MSKVRSRGASSQRECRFDCLVTVGKGPHLAPDNLSGLVPLAGDDEDVSALKSGDSGANGFGAVADFARIRRAGKRLSSNRGGILAARIVVRYDHDVGEVRGRFAHQWTLAFVSIATAAEDHMQLAGDVRTERREDLLQRIGRVRIIDIDRRAGGCE